MSPLPLSIWLRAVRRAYDPTRSWEIRVTKYLLSLHYADGPRPPPEALEAIMKEVEAVKDEMKSAGVWVYGGGLESARSAHVVRAEGPKLRITDGPFVEAKEYLGG